MHNILLCLYKDWFLFSVNRHNYTLTQYVEILTSQADN